MSVGHDPQAPIEPVMREALDWLVRLKPGVATTADVADLVDWRARSPAHDAAFREVAAYRRMACSLPPAEPCEDRIAPSGPGKAMNRRTVLAGGAAIAASVAGAMLVRPPLELWPSLADLLADHRTGPGERLAFAPTAGVEVEMNSRTSLSLTDRGAGIRLVEGETFVTVAGRAAPFVVRAGDRLMSSRAAVFNVRTGDGALCVTCVSGAVEGRRGAERTAVRSGEQLVYPPDGDALIRRVDVSLALAWRRGLLIFDGTPLAEVVAEINRYRPGRIILADGAIGTRPVNGVFHTNQIDSAVAQIEQLLGVRLTRLPGGVVLMG